MRFFISLIALAFNEYIYINISHELNNPEDHWGIDLVVDIRTAIIKYIQNHTSLKKAWIIAVAPTKEKREWFKQSLNARVVVVNPGKEVCIRRLQQVDNKRTDEFYDVIQKWYKDYEYVEDDMHG